MNQNLLLLVIFSLLVSCSSTHVLTSDLKQNQIQDIAYFRPIGSVSLIEKGNKAIYNDSLTNIANDMEWRVVHSLKNDIHITTDIFPTDSTTLIRLATEAVSIIDDASDREIEKNIPSTPLIDSLILNSGKRYGLITVIVGFVRDENNYNNQLFKNIAVGALSFGHILSIPTEGNSTIFTIIADGKEKHLCFFGKSSFNNSDPINEEAVTRMMHKIFTRDF